MKPAECHQLIGKVLGRLGVLGDCLVQLLMELLLVPLLEKILGPWDREVWLESVVVIYDNCLWVLGEGTVEGLPAPHTA